MIPSPEGLEGRSCGTALETGDGLGGRTGHSPDRPRARPPTHLVGLRLALLSLVLLALVGCARISDPQGGSGGLLVDDTLYFGTREGEVVALEAIETGEMVWPVPFQLQGEEDQQAVYGTPVLDGETIYVGGYDGYVYAASIFNGETKGRWPEDLEGVGPIVGSPAVSGGLVLVASADSNLYALEITNEDEASVDFRQGWRFTTGDKLWATPAISDGVAYLGSLDHNLYAIDLEDGEELWRFEAGGGIAAEPVIDDGTVYIGSFDSVFYALDAESGEEIWRFDEAGNWFWGRPVIHGDAIYAPSLDGNLYVLDADTGRLQWKVETDRRIVGSPAILGDILAVPSDDGKIRLVSISERGQELGVCSIDEKIGTPLVARPTPDDPAVAGFIYFGAPGPLNSRSTYQDERKPRRALGTGHQEGPAPSAQRRPSGLLAARPSGRCQSFST